MRKIAFALFMTLMLSCLALAADTYQPGKVVKWDKGTYPDGKKTKVLGSSIRCRAINMLYSVARHKETKPKMQPGDTVQLEVKGNKATVINAQGHKEQYQVVGQAQAPGQ